MFKRFFSWFSGMLSVFFVTGTSWAIDFDAIMPTTFTIDDAALTNWYAAIVTFFVGVVIAGFLVSAVRNPTR